MGSESPTVAGGGLVARITIKMGKLEQKPLLLCSMKIVRILDRKKALRMCVKKLKKISDPESKLCKAVLINNTLQSLKNCDDIRLQNENKDVDGVMDCPKIEPQAPKKSNFSPEDILSEIVLPPPLVPHMENFTCRNYKDWSEEGGQIISERFREQRNLTVGGAFNDKICDNSLSGNCVNNNLVNNLLDKSSQALLSNRDNNFYDNNLHNFTDNNVHNISDNKLRDNRTFSDQKSGEKYFLQNFEAKVVCDAEPPTDITLEEIDSSNGLCADFSLYNSFISDHRTGSDKFAKTEQNSSRNYEKISQSERYSQNNMLINEQNYFMSCEQNFSNNSLRSEQTCLEKPRSEQNSYRLAPSEQNSFKLPTMMGVSYRQQ